MCRLGIRTGIGWSGMVAKSNAKNESAAEWVALSALKPWKDNPRKNDGEPVRKVTESIKRFGFGAPILARLENGEIIAGHTRWKAAKELGLDRVPVRYLDLDPADAHLLALADNRVASEAEWDDAMLAAVLADLKAQGEELGAAGFDESEIAKLLADAGGPPDDAPDAQMDRAEELRNEWGVETGQLWVLGDHRLLCGDSTKAEDVAQLKRCQTLVFDPPWNLAVPTPTGHESMLVFTDGRNLGDTMRSFGPPTWLFVWDCVSSWYTPNRPLQRTKLALWYGQIGAYDFNGSHYGNAGEQREVENSRGGYTFVPDPRGKHLGDLYQQAITRLHAESEHSHSKPIDWVRMLLANCTSGDVFDPFSGSGTTIVACEQLGRKCRAIEISPGYVAVALQRFKDATGKTPTLAGERMSGMGLAPELVNG